MRRLHRRGTRRGFLLALVLVSLVLAAVTAERRMAPVLAAYAQKQVEILGVEATARAMRRAIADRVDYQDLIAVERDHEGRVTLVRVNTGLMSRILADVEESVQGSLKSLEGGTFDIPLGLLLGSDLLAAYGPTITARILSIGSVKIAFDQDFQTAGVNQTRHTIYLETQARIRVLIPLHQEDTTITTRVPIVETIIVGPVPEQYLNLDWLFPPAPRP